ncbi:small-conductance mechanosensitive channel [Beggiatoa alba B18LD]|uniref:Small-conductance mechanosensitive channel n=1 Tax=Beggiatoa alba B18LD TaxID=395493 RepID=I3CFD0_9GAMM|nr:mechanosensitive ion channel domain-containing protein [Beggiatoa alba]EIJ42323.1 small-conductance mechanosensitive channel [Beggiatoa alba B18LD]
MMLYIRLCLFIGIWLFNAHCLADTNETPTTTPTPTPAYLPEQALEERKQALQTEIDALQAIRQQLQTQQNEWNTIKDHIATRIISDQEKQDAELAQQEAKLLLDKYNIAVQTLSDNLNKRETEQKNQQAKLDALYQQSVDTEGRAVKSQHIAELTDNLAIQAEIVQITKAQLETAQQHAAVAEQLADLNTQRFLAINNRYNAQSQQQLASQIEQHQQGYISQANDIQKQLNSLQDGGKSWQREFLNGRLQTIDEQSQQAVRRLRLEQIRVSLKYWTELTQDSPINYKEVASINSIHNELNNLQHQLQQKISVFQQQQTLLQKRGEELTGQEKQLYQQTIKLLKQIESHLQADLALLPPLLTQITETSDKLEKFYTQQVKTTLLKRRVLPNSLNEWERLANDFTEIPSVFWQQLELTLLNFKHTAESIPQTRWSMIGLGVAIWLILFITLRHYLTYLFLRLEAMAEHSFAVDGFLTLLRLLDKNAYSIAFTGLFALFIWFAQPNLTSILFAFILIFPWIIVKVPLNLAWLVLSEKDEILPKYQRLYRNLRWVIMVTGLFIVITALAHLIEIKEGATIWIDTLFMIFLSIIVIPVMMIRRQILLFLKDKMTLKTHWLLILRFVSLVIPLTILTVSFLAIIGYINLGWYVAKTLSILGLVLTGWLIVQGVLADIIYLWKNYALKYSQNGLLWTQDIIPLFHRLLGIALAVVALANFFWLNGWLNDVAMQEGLQHFANYSFYLFGIPINIKNLILAGVTLWFVFWFGGWIRRVTYRWIYINIIDLGVRNSLSVFTQYVILLIGLLIGLQLMGIDLTTFAVFAGALGVGVGLGLQNIANNFFSGILLLIERPLRTGDIVNIGGNFEGTVTKLGIRSITIKTWDKQDVIVPNSRLIAEAFINWTHSDHLLRLTLYVGISYENDPHQAKNLILEQIRSIPSILTEPAPTVTLWEFADSAVTFRIDIHINLQTSSTLTTRDALLFAIWDGFKTTGITIPYPQHDVYIKASPDLANIKL